MIQMKQKQQAKDSIILWLSFRVSSIMMIPVAAR